MNSRWPSGRWCGTNAASSCHAAVAVPRPSSVYASGYGLTDIARHVREIERGRHIRVYQ
jgi:hypothetical protein